MRVNGHGFVLQMFNFWPITKTPITLYPFMTDCLIYRKIWLRSDKNCRRSGVLKFPAPNGPVLTKISKCHKFFDFWQITKRSITFYSPVTTLCVKMFGSDQMKIVGGEAL